MLCFVGTIATLGCDDLLGPGTDAALRTDRTEYRLQDTGIGLEGRIPFTFTNRTGGAVYVVNCNGNTPPALQKRIDGRWVHAWSPVVSLCLSPPIVIGAGATYADTLWVSAGHPGNNFYPKFEVLAVAGTYRLIWPNVLKSYDDSRSPFGESLPLQERVSNPFEITR